MRFFTPLPIPNADAAVLVRAFSCFRELNGGSALTQFFTRMWDRAPDLAFYFEIENLRPAVYIARIEGKTIVLIDGVSSQAQCNAVMRSYEGVLQSGYNNPDNHTFTVWAQYVFDRLATLGGISGSDITLVGWSAGGAVAARVPTLLQSVKPATTSIRVISFGAPRLGDEALSRRVQSLCDATRYMAFDDPIPNYPPRSGTFTWIPFAVGIRASLRFSQFVHHYGGICIDENGDFIDRTTPTNGNITPSVALDAYWNGLAANTLSQHSLSNYSRLLELRATYSNPEPPQQHTRGEHTDDTPPSQLHSQERHTFTAVRELQQSQESQHVRIPKARLAQARRVGRVWYVVWNNVAIMMTPTRRRAQGLARELNAFLRRMQSTAYVSPEQLEQQIRAFLQAAADDQSDIRPTLSTTIPVP